MDDHRRHTRAINDDTYAAWNAHDSDAVVAVFAADQHADRWVLSGTHRGELFGIAPTGRQVRVDGATFTRLGPDGLVIEDVQVADTLGLMAQLDG